MKKGQQNCWLCFAVVAIFSRNGNGRNIYFNIWKSVHVHKHRNKRKTPSSINVKHVLRRGSDLTVLSTRSPDWYHPKELGPSHWSPVSAALTVPFARKFCRCHIKSLVLSRNSRHTKMIRCSAFPSNLLLPSCCSVVFSFSSLLLSSRCSVLPSIFSCLPAALFFSLLFSCLHAALFSSLLFSCLHAALFFPLIFSCLQTALFSPLILSCLQTALFSPLIFSCLQTALFSLLILSCLQTALFFPLIFSCLQTALFSPLILPCLQTALFLSLIHISEPTRPP